MRVFVFLLAGCAPDHPDGAVSLRPGPDDRFAAKYASPCADGATVPGIDVSYWQSNIDWGGVAGDGVEFAIIRVSHGLGTYDSRFQDNWAGAQAHGVRRGVYQYFSGSDDPTAQAQLLLDEMGELQDGDLPPTLDVEGGDNEGIPVSQMNANIATWMDVVSSATGRTPMIYTGAYGWTDLTGDADFTDSPLWTANWEVECPLIPNPWTDWTFWQHSSTGSIGGISTGVDLDVFNGDAAALDAFAYHPAPECSGTCTIAREGETVVEEDATCACAAGQLASTSGHGGHAYTVGADMAAPSVDDSVSWPLRFERAGTYDVWVYVPALNGLSAGAVVTVTHDGVTDLAPVDQSTVSDGWAYVGAFHFATAGTQSVVLGDAYDDATNAGATVAIDALRVTLADDGECECTDGDSEEQDCSDGTLRTRTCDACDWSAWSPCEGHASVVSPEGGCACAAGGEPAGLGALLAGSVAMAGAVLRRRRGEMSR